MEKEIILENLDENIVNEATFYNQQNIPSQISKALYLYGSTTDYQVLGFVDASDDGSQGMIFTDQGVYFCFREPHFFLYEDIEELVLVKKEEGFDFYAKIKTKANTFLFKNKYPRYQINLKLSQIDFVQISYYRYSFYPSKYLVNGSGNKIVFKFNMLDGSQYIIENLVSSDKETFSKGIELMKKNGVRFVDSYHLLDIIRSNKNLDQYIVAIEKEKKHD